MDILDGLEINGCKLQVTQVSHLLPFKPKWKSSFIQTKLGLIKEDEDSDDADPTPNRKEKESQLIDENDKEKHEEIENRINDIINIDDNEHIISNNTNEKPVEESLPVFPVNTTSHMHNQSFNNDWNPVTNREFYPPMKSINTYTDHFTVDQVNYRMHRNHSYQFNQNMIAANSNLNNSNNFNSNQGRDQLNKTLVNNSSSSTGNIDNFSYSEDSSMFDGFNRTQSVKLYPSNINSCALTSRHNTSYESGILDDEEIKHSSRSYFSSGSHGSNPNFTSTCARTFTSSDGILDRNNYAGSGSNMSHDNSQMQLTYDMHQMHSSFDIGNDPRMNSYRLTPRHQFNSFHDYTRNQYNHYSTIS